MLQAAMSIEHRSDQLVRASAIKSYDPMAAVDWSVPIDDTAPHMPPSYLPLYGTPVYDVMIERERYAYSRHECAIVMTNGIFFENVLMHLILKYLYRRPPDDPALRYLMLEVADECRHSWMFAEYIRRAGTPAYQPTPTLLRLGEIVKSTFDPVASFIAILAAEELTDLPNRGMTEDAIHPTVRQIMKIHVEEEARHISFARTFLAEHWPRASRARKLLVSVQALVAARAIASATVNPAVYRTLGIRDGVRTARRNPHHHRRITNGLKRFTGFLAELGVIVPASRPIWVRMGLLAPEEA